MNDKHIVHSSGSLRPVTSTTSGRYNEKPGGATLTSFGLAPGFFLSSKAPEPDYLPPHWHSFVHPEGQLYFFRDSPLPVITEACLYDPAVFKSIEHWIEQIETLLHDSHIQPSRDMELFLVPQSDDCGYYLVDYESRTQFWLHDMNTDDLNLSGALSHSHLKLQIEALFWQHIEYFPMHRSAISQDSVDELISIFSHGLLDKITSTTSTFWYDKDECTRFLKLLKTSRAHLTDGRQICVVARLWASVMNYRFAVHYGTQHCRLDRNKAVLWADPEEVKLLSTVLSKLSFKTYDTHLARLKDLFVDRYLYAEQWRPFIADNLNEWRETACMASASLILHVFNVVVPECSTVLSVASFALLSISLVASVLLLHRYKTMQKVSTTVAHDHLSSIESDKYGFQLAALAYSLPTSLYLWGLLVFFLNCAYTLIKYFSAPAAFSIISFLVLVFISFQYATSNWQFQLGFPRFVSSIFRRRHISLEGSDIV